LSLPKPNGSAAYACHEEHIVEPIFEDIRGYIQSMAA
jgi:hypothetical protein